MPFIEIKRMDGLWNLCVRIPYLFICFNGILSNIQQSVIQSCPSGQNCHFTGLSLEFLVSSDEQFGGMSIYSSSVSLERLFLNCAENVLSESSLFSTHSDVSGIARVQHPQTLRQCHSQSPDSPCQAPFGIQTQWERLWCVLCFLIFNY